MNKPLTVAYEDFGKAVLDLIDNSGLPLFVVHQALNTISASLTSAEKREFEQNRKMYEESQKEENEKSE